MSANDAMSAGAYSPNCLGPKADISDLASFCSWTTIQSERGFRNKGGTPAITTMMSTRTSVAIESISIWQSSLEMERLLHGYSAAEMRLTAIRMST